MSDSAGTHEKILSQKLYGVRSIQLTLDSSRESCEYELSWSDARGGTGNMFLLMVVGRYKLRVVL